MSIDRTSPLKPVSTVQQREVQESAVPAGRSAQSAAPDSASVTLSNAQSRLTQSDASDINMERVEALKTAIRNGELKMDAGKIADALIQEAQQSLQGK
ncbi:flagellar biosynthesis anti-sigma factor FlgM [Entomohabitans teleogrylli]|uniref:flagellar biosynthesis anti-sigma factor FlgM n=1 Tax=Entomohabitans teleogrylli TaxID=1384589 RepID=UPI00073D3F6F|nr:flagellar biosynthesis anti-sigma factor FlgM [Entomohabitans teleogrylli]